MAKFKTASHLLKSIASPEIKVKQDTENPLRFQLRLTLEVDFSALIGGSSKRLAGGIEKILGAKR